MSADPGPGSSLDPSPGPDPQGAPTAGPPAPTSERTGVLTDLRSAGAPKLIACLVAVLLCASALRTRSALALTGYLAFLGSGEAGAGVLGNLLLALLALIFLELALMVAAPSLAPSAEQRATRPRRGPRRGTGVLLLDVPMALFAMDMWLWLLALAVEGFFGPTRTWSVFFLFGLPTTQLLVIGSTLAGRPPLLPRAPGATDGPPPALSG